MPLKTFTVQGEDYFEKEVKPHSKTASKIYLQICKAKK